MQMSMFALGVVLAVSSLINVGEGSAGVKDYGDSCSIVASGIQFIAALGDSKNQYQDACDVSKGLICAINQCKCLPGAEYKQNLFEQVFGGGRCSGVAKTSAGAAIMLSFIPLIYYFRN